MNLSGNTTKNKADNRAASPYLPSPALIERVTRLTEKDRLFSLKPIEGTPFKYSPGQFFMAGLPGYGEAPFSVASPAASGGHLEFCIRAAGNLTNAIHRLAKGDLIWVRGPFGRGFDADELKGRDIVFVAGGIGIVPMRALIKTVIGEAGFGRLTLIYGVKAPQELLFMGEMDEWASLGMDVRITVDRPHPGWGGNVGVVTTLIQGLDIKGDNTVAVIIGPPVMYKFAVLSLRDKRIPDDRMLLSLERRMKCGLGKCGHCQINSVYVCQCGPVFRLSELKGLTEAI